MIIYLFSLSSWRWRWSVRELKYDVIRWDDGPGNWIAFYADWHLLGLLKAESLFSNENSFYAMFHLINHFLTHFSCEHTRLLESFKKWHFKLLPPLFSFFAARGDYGHKLHNNVIYLMSFLFMLIVRAEPSSKAKLKRMEIYTLFFTVT